MNTPTLTPARITLTPTDLPDYSHDAQVAEAQAWAARMQAEGHAVPVIDWRAVARQPVFTLDAREAVETLAMLVRESLGEPVSRDDFDAEYGSGSARALSAHYGSWAQALDAARALCARDRPTPPPAHDPELPP